MSRKKAAKPYWEMTTEELRETTKEFDDEFVADKAQPLTPQMQVQATHPATPAEAQETFRSDRVLGSTSTALVFHR